MIPSPPWMSNYCCWATGVRARRRFVTDFAVGPSKRIGIRRTAFVSSSTFLACAVGAGEIRLHIWDFGGQDIYHGTHTLFLRSAGLFALVWAHDTENNDEYERDGLRFRNYRLQYWAELARHQGHGQSPLLAVQTKCDRVEDEAPLPPIGIETIQALPYFKHLHYGALNNRGRAALDEALADAIGWLRDPERRGTPMLGAGRMRVRRRLEELRDADATSPPEQRRWRTLSQEAFRELCDQAGGISSPAQFLNYLSNAGVVFYRQGLFNDQIILDQAWALDAVYAAFDRELCYRQLMWTRGRFTRALLESLVWRGYGVEEQNLFLSMMRSCGICFVHREAGDDTEYVAPDLLPDRMAVAAELAEKWPAGEVTATREFVYPMLHPALIREVIARIGSRAGVNALYWKGGVCVYEAETRSRGLIEQEALADGRARMRLQTGAGRAEALLQILVAQVEEAQQQLGIWPIEVVGGRIGGRRRADSEPTDPDTTPPCRASASRRPLNRSGTSPMPGATPVAKARSVSSSSTACARRPRRAASASFATRSSSASATASPSSWDGWERETGCS